MLVGIQSQGDDGYRFLITPSSVNSDLYYDLGYAPGGFWNHVRSDGGDIRVYKQDGVTEVARQVLAFDATNHRGSLFFKTDGGTAFYVSYGKPGDTEPAAGAANGSQSVWESAASLVMHLEDMTDATANAHNGSSAAAPTFVGTNSRIEKCASFAGAQNIVLPGGHFNSETVTWQSWVYFTSTNTAYVLNQSAAGYHYTALSWASSKLTWTAYGSSDYLFTLTTPTLNLNQWYFVTATCDGADAYLYVDNQTPLHGTYSAAIGNATTTAIGAQSDNLGAGRLSGRIDELRIYTRALTSDEHATALANQGAVDTFWTTGAELLSGSLSPAAYTYNPLYEAGCKLALRASRASASGGVVTSILDLSPGRNDPGVLAGTELQTNQINGLPGVVATGTGQGLTNTWSRLTTHDGPSHVFAVVKMAAAPAWSAFNAAPGAGGTLFEMPYCTSEIANFSLFWAIDNFGPTSGYRLVYNDSMTASVAMNAPPSPIIGVPFLFELAAADGNGASKLAFYLNGSQQVLKSNDVGGVLKYTWTDGPGYRVGCRYAANEPLPGPWCEFWFWNRVLSDTEAARVRAWLMSLYGLT
jgi:hypothetical protein